MKKRILSFALVLVMCLALLPSAALADDSDFVYKTNNGVLTRYSGPGGDIVIPEGVTAIFDRTFRNMTNITSVVIPDSVTSIGYGAFENCSNLESVTIGDGVEYIGNFAFSNCTSLTDVSMGNSIFRIYSEAFIDCTSLESITVPNNVKEIDLYAFKNCTSLRSFTVPDGIYWLANLFEGCTSLESITIPDSVKRMGHFPSSVTIYGYSYSIAERTANKYGNPFISIGISEDAYEWIDPNTPEEPEEPEEPEDSTPPQESYPSSSITVEIPPAGTTVSSTPTLDLTSASTWAQEGIKNAVEADLVPQNLQSSYTQATTRAEFAALAVALYEQAKGAEITERKTFDDTTDANVEKAAAIGVVAGVGDNKFSPDSGLTREQAAVMLARLADVIGKPLAEQGATFADNASISTWAIEEVGQIQAAGIMSGVGNNTFAPQDAYTREQSIVTVLRLYEVVK